MNAVMKAKPLNRVPVAPLREILLREIECRQGGLSALVSEIATARGQAEHSVARRLYSILHGRESHRDGGARVKTHVMFETADAILTALGLQELWHTDPELAAIYESPIGPEAEKPLRTWWLERQALRDVDELFAAR